MVVEVRMKRRGMTGLHVGDGNVQRLFPPDKPAVELELDHLRIVCTLKPEFWEGEPDIEDDRLVAWLESKRMNGKLASGPAPLLMVPSGENAFKVMPVDQKEVQEPKYLVGLSA
jgi:hypothetical protein